MDFQDDNIETLGLSIRTINMLKRAGITKLSDLGKERSAEDMMKVRNLGRKSLEELLQVLKEQGIKLTPTEPENVSLKQEEKDTEKRNGILDDSINLLNVSKNTIEKIESTTNCTLIKDLWILTPKELCVQTGLTRQELIVLIDDMERVAKELNGERYLHHIEMCRKCLETCKKYIPDETDMEEETMDGYELEPEYCCERENSIEHKYEDVTIEDMKLSVRSYNCLRRAGIYNVYNLLNKSYEEIKRIRNLGAKSRIEVLSRLMEMVDVMPAGLVLTTILPFDAEIKELLICEVETLEDLISLESSEVLKIVGYKKAYFREIVEVVEKQGYHFKDYDECDSIEDYIEKKSAVALTKLFNATDIINKLKAQGINDVVSLQDFCMDSIEKAGFSKTQIKQLMDELLMNSISLKGDKIKKCDFCGNEYVYVVNYSSDERNYCEECADKVKRIQNLKNVDVELNMPEYSSFKGGEKGFIIMASIHNITKKLCRVKLDEFYFVSDGRKWEPKFYLTGYQFEDEDLMPGTIKSAGKIWCGNPWEEKKVEIDDYVVIELILKDNIKQMYKFVFTESGWRKDDFFSVKIR